MADPELSYVLPNCMVLVEGEPVTLCEDGSVVLYCDGDVKLSLQELTVILRLLHRFMFERDRLRTS